MPASSTARTPKFAALALAAALLAVVAGCAGDAPIPENLPPPGVAANPSTVEYYQRRVQPILRSNCYHCHSGFLPKGGLRLDSQKNILHGGEHGAVLIPGDPEHSKLIQSIRHEGSTAATKPMPPNNKISDADIEMITAWINAGAIMPPDTH
jgi:hypothetical protein